MAHITTVDLTAGVPTAGTGTVYTIDALLAVLPAALAANGGLKIEGVASGTAVPVSVASIPSHAVTNAGTFATQAAQSGTWTVQPGNTANTTAWKVDNTAALDKGAGTGGSATQRVIIDSSQVDGSEYETVAASQTAQVLGATGATGDFISGLLVVPATTSPGNVLLLDNATSMTVFTGGATSVSNLVPFFIPLGMTSVSGAWKVTTGANVSVIGVGNFT